MPRLRRGPQYAQRDIQVTLAPSVSRRVLRSAARVRPASATARTTRRAMAPTMTLRRTDLPCVLSPPALPHGLRQNTRPSGYAGVVALRFASMCSSVVRRIKNRKFNAVLQQCCWIRRGGWSARGREEGVWAGAGRVRGGCRGFRVMRRRAPWGRTRVWVYPDGSRSRREENSGRRGLGEARSVSRLRDASRHGGLARAVTEA